MRFVRAAEFALSGWFSHEGKFTVCLSPWFLKGRFGLGRVGLGLGFNGLGWCEIGLKAGRTDLDRFGQILDRTSRKGRFG